MKITIVGAGFSGLTLAYFLTKRGDQIEIYDKRESPGGLLHTRRESFGLVETAANGLLNSPLVETLFADVGVSLAERKKTRARRYIFRGRPRRWPLTVGESLRLGVRLAWAWMTRNLRPQPEETIKGWGERVGGRGFAEFLLSPALQGIYAGDAGKMSADLILARMFGPREKKSSLRGTVAPADGMGRIIENLTAWLKNHGVQFHWNAQPPAGTTLVVATSAWDAAEFLRDKDKAAAEVLAGVEVLPLVTVTMFYDSAPEKWRGFGCLFPQSEKFKALGVLFNTDIFEGRGARSETWILGGALHRDVTQWSDEQILKAIGEDRARLFGSAGAPTKSVIQRWPKALPHYTVAWRQSLSQLQPKPGIFLTGNYLGAIGLSRILHYNQSLAEKIHA
jgi:protoporphyrinogen/coproporphyrinogen III oxidase